MYRRAISSPSGQEIMNRIQRSWLLLKSSLQVIFRNKVLLVFPVLIFTLTLLIALFFLCPLFCGRLALRTPGWTLGHHQRVLVPFANDHPKPSNRARGRFDSARHCLSLRDVFRYDVLRDLF
jgi:hypothetical protein